MLVPALVRSGDVAEQTILDLADRIEERAGREYPGKANQLSSMALALRMWVIESAVEETTPSERRADHLRSKFKIVDAE